MSEQENRKITPASSGIFNDLSTRIKLIFRLLADSRVNPLLKLLPVGALIYLIVPDPIIGPVDDALVVWLGSFLFVELCPPGIVQEHLEALGLVVSATPMGSGETDDEVIEGVFWEKKE